MIIEVVQDGPPPEPVAARARRPWWIAVLLLALLMAAVIDVGLNRSSTPRAVPEPGPPDAFSQLAPPVVYPCAVANACLTAAGVPTGVAASASAAFPAARVSASISSFNARMPVLDLAQLTLIDGSYTIVLTEERDSESLRSDTTTLWSSESRRFLFSGQRGAWQLTAVITSSARPVNQSLVASAQSWLSNATVPD